MIQMKHGYRASRVEDQMVRSDMNPASSSGVVTAATATKQANRSLILPRGESKGRKNTHHAHELRTVNRPRLFPVEAIGGQNSVPLEADPRQPVHEVKGGPGVLENLPQQIRPCSCNMAGQARTRNDLTNRGHGLIRSRQPQNMQSWYAKRKKVQPFSQFLV